MPKIIAICSGKGGVGKTNLAVNLGIALQKIGLKTTIFDADLGLANVNILVNSIPRYSLLHFIRGEKTLSEIIQATDYGINIISGGSGFTELVNLSEQDRISLIQKLSLLSDSDVFIIDTPAGASRNVINFLQVADKIITISTPEPTAVADCYAIIKIITQFIPKEKLNLNLVINRAANYIQASGVAKRIATIAKTFLDIELPFLGPIYQDRQLESAVLDKIPVVIKSPNSRASVAIRAIASKIISNI